LYYTQNNANDFSLPVAFEIVSKTEKYIDKKTNKAKRKSKITNKNSKNAVESYFLFNLSFCKIRKIKIDRKIKSFCF